MIYGRQACSELIDLGTGWLAGLLSYVQVQLSPPSPSAPVARGPWHRREAGDDGSLVSSSLGVLHRAARSAAPEFVNQGPVDMQVDAPEVGLCFSAREKET